MAEVRYQIKIAGIVQGVGFRPFVWRQANRLGLAGWVLNDSSGIQIEVQGDPNTIDEFCRCVQQQAPPLAKIDTLQKNEVPRKADSEFLILDSIGVERPSTPVSADVTTCDACLAELFDPANRRHLYPFINCTNCGPRFTIVEDLPYDRPRTTMKSFPMCDKCQSEYDDPNNRRFHAQPNACPACGPTIWFVRAESHVGQFARPQSPPDTTEAVAYFHSAIRQGEIVAVKGIGGFHFACDAANENAVSTLRQRKGRIDKPFAVMVRDVEQAGNFVEISKRERQILESRERPIVLLQKRKGVDSLANGVSPQNNFVGVMLPCSPLHHLLANSGPLVMTSGNLSDEPIARTNAEAKDRLAHIADSFLLHDRKIHVACDDSVVRSIDDQLLPIRRSRGYSPIPISLERDGPSILAVGGELKSTFCLTQKSVAFLSQHIGDMGNIETMSAMRQMIEHFLQLFRIEPKAICADLHPGYLSGQFAESFSTTLGIPIFRVQHHFAHIASLIAEHSLDPEQKIIGCCFDGTGYGTDQTIWGGEFLIANSISFERFASLDSFSLPGGDASIRRPGRVALSLLWSRQLNWDVDLAPVRSLSTTEQNVLRRQLERGLNCVPTSSMGRLFDAVAALIGIRQEVNYEAQAAMEMEALATSAIDDVTTGYEFQILEQPVLRLGVTNLLLAICADLNRGVTKSEIAAKFHVAVVNGIRTVCRSARDNTGIHTVGLTGGVFQNVLLLRLAQQKLHQDGFQVFTNSLVPPNDGGLALGQSVVARNWYQNR